MKTKSFLIAVSVLLVAAAATINVYVANNSTKSALNNVSLLTLEALTAAEKYPSGADITNPAECSQRSGYWGTYMKCIAGGIEQVTCTVSGKLTFGVITIEGSFTKGSKYPIAWERYGCETLQNSCCISASQGVRITVQ